MAESKQSIGGIVRDAIKGNEKNLREMERKLKDKLSESGCGRTREMTADDVADDVAWRSYDSLRAAEGTAKHMAYLNDLKNKDNDDTDVRSDDELGNVGPQTEAEKDILARGEEVVRRNRLRF